MTAIYVIDLPQTNYRPPAPNPWPLPPALQRPSLAWLVLALALAAMGVNLAALLITAGVAVATAYSLALLPCCLGLGLILALLHLEVTLCPANTWLGV